MRVRSLHRPRPSALRVMVLLAVAATLLGGCFKHSVRDERKQPGPRTTNAWKPYVVVGLAPLGKSTVVASCPGGIALYENRTSFLNGLVAAVTFNLFTPITVAYACAAGEQPAGSTGEATQQRRGDTQQPSTPGHTPPPEEEPYDVPIL